MKEWIRKLTAALILDLSDRAGIIDIEYDLDNDTRNELKETWAKIIKSHIDGELAQLRAVVDAVTDNRRLHWSHFKTWAETLKSEQHYTSELIALLERISQALRAAGEEER